MWSWGNDFGEMVAHKEKGDITESSQPVARKYSDLTEIVDIFTQTCKVCIHDEDVAETDFEYIFETPKGFRPGFGKPCVPPTGFWGRATVTY